MLNLTYTTPGPARSIILQICEKNRIHQSMKDVLDRKLLSISFLNFQIKIWSQLHPIVLLTMQLALKLKHKSSVSSD